MTSSDANWHHAGAPMLYFLGFVVIVSGSILLLGLAGRGPRREDVESLPSHPARIIPRKD